MPIIEYLKKMENPVDALANIDLLFSDKDLVILILNGLRQECAPVITSVDNCEAPITFDELSRQLITQEMRLDSYSHLQNNDQPTTTIPTQHGSSSTQTENIGNRSKNFH